MAKVKEEEQQNTNSWITTYTDLMTLLLTFFVLLISMSVVDPMRQRVALNSLVGAFGFKPGGHSVIGVKKGMNITVGAAPLQKEQVDFERLRNITFRNGLQADVEVQTEGEKIVITLNNRVLFPHGSSTLSDKGKNYLKQLAPVLRQVPGLVELRGYADPTEVLFDQNKLKKGAIISTKRAVAVYRYLNKIGKIPHKKMVAHGFGVQSQKKPAIKGTTNFNRQVKIICDYRASIPYRVKRGEKKKSYYLDFKGFFFKLRGS
ncbi:MAG TPA: hypothetical protein ENG73_11020 [Desulfobacterales bacterium]|nr:hypothetical protein [Desulfobacterales bacterium]